MDYNKVDINLSIQNKNIVYNVTCLCEGNITYYTERKSSSGKINFNIALNVLNKGKVYFEEGDRVFLIVNKIKMFNGFIFSKKRTKENIVSVTAYDQVRYLKNKDTYYYENLKADDVIKMISKDFNLEIGEIENTNFILPPTYEQNQTLLDIILNTLDKTTLYTGKVYVFFDNYGKLTLKNIENMRVPFIILSSSAGIIDFQYNTDIDTDTFNNVKLFKENKETGKNEIYISKDSENEKKWGLLQYYQNVSDNYTDLQVKLLADNILKGKNRVKKSFSIENIGYPQIRAGNSVYVQLNDSFGTEINQYFIIESCIHTFNNNEHNMKIDLSDMGGFSL